MIIVVLNLYVFIFLHEFSYLIIILYDLTGSIIIVSFFWIIVISLIVSSFILELNRMFFILGMIYISGVLQGKRLVLGYGSNALISFLLHLVCRYIFISVVWPVTGLTSLWWVETIISQVRMLLKLYPR
jgi:hypothetical protein